jgi:hypothetical protein
VVILRAQVNAHVPCRREVDLENVQLSDQLLAHRRVDDVGRDDALACATALEAAVAASTPSRADSLSATRRVGLKVAAAEACGANLP